MKNNRKKYSKPNININKFISNEFISVCNTKNLSCLNMNPAKIVYKDKNKNGKLDDSEKVVSNQLSFREQQDCDTTGDPTGGKHSSENLGDLVFVGYGSFPYTFTSAYLVSDVKKDSPHFLSVESINHS